MYAELTEQQRLIVETARVVGKRYGLEYWRDLDSRKAYPEEMWRAICENGLAGAALPESHGGSGLGMVELALVVEALAEGGAGSTVGQLFMLNPIFAGVPLAKHSSAALRDRYLPGLISGDIHACMALTEPDAGTNSLELRTRAEPNGNGWLLNGRKIWITGVERSDIMIVVARTRKIEEVSRRTEGITLFLIDTKRAGVSHTTIEKLGTNTLSSCMVYLENVPVAPSDIVGEEGAGWHVLLDVLNTERIVTTAGLVGTGRLAIRVAVDFANQRKVFNDVPIGRYQGIQFPLAQGHAELECARIMNLHAAACFDHGRPYGSQANQAKLIASQAAS
ncbi:MAG TPA: acyl-CoA dehydrogenase family protein, partial [bacterium]